MSDLESLGAPGRILLATDLSCRCDRAFDRAVELAGRWDARLFITHVLPPPDLVSDQDRNRPAWRRDADPLETMRRRIARELAGEIANVEIRVEEGEPVERLLEVADREGCDLIVTGIARDEPFGRMFLGTTVNQLVRRSSVPILVVKDRANGPYRKIAVATDFSESSRRALVTAVGYFAGAEFVLLHGHDIPFGSLQEKEESPGTLRAMEEKCRAEFLADTPIGDALLERIPLLIEQGAPERLIWDYVREEEVDLTVVGSHGHGAVYDILIGSMTKELLESAAGDMLVVIDPRARE